jgi:hypothetical protein
MVARDAKTPDERRELWSQSARGSRIHAALRVRGKRALRVLAVAVVILLALRLRVFRVLAAPVLIVAILAVGGGSFSVR